MICKNIVAEALVQKTGIDKDSLLALIEEPKEKGHGDYAFPCFRLAKELKKSPVQISQGLAEEFAGDKSFEKVEAVGPYLNFFIQPALRAELLLKAYQAAKTENVPFGSSCKDEGKTVVLDYSSINVAKPFHIGHLRTTVIGNAISRILRYTGYKTVSINHLGDWGTQFGKMIVAYRKWGSPEVEAQGVRGLVGLYVRFHDEAKNDPSLDDEARATFVKLEQGDEECLALWKRFVEISLKEVDRVYQLLDVQFDSYLGESFYRDKTDAVVKRLKEHGLLTESEGAQIVDLEADKMPPCLILKKDGSTLYATRDIAAAYYRHETYNFDKCVYVTGLEQKLHFAQWFKVVEKIGEPWASGLFHVPYGLVSLESGKLSTRDGRVEFLEDILKEAIAKAKAIMQEKNPDLPNMDEVAEQVGVGAVVFHDLFNNRIKDVTFSIDSVLNFDGETGPYVQYSYARARSVLRKADKMPSFGDIKPELLADDCTQELLHLIETFPDAVSDAQEKFEPYLVTRQTLAISTAFNKFYHENKILSAPDDVRDARLVLTEMAADCIKEGLYLIGVRAPEQM